MACWSARHSKAHAALALRPRRGKTQVTGGLYAEAMALMGGFFIIEAAVKDETMRVVSLCPVGTLVEDVGWRIKVQPAELLFEHALRKFASASS